MENIGRKTKVRLLNGEVVEGWVFAETPQAFYISLDINGENIRLIPVGKYQSISYSDENISKVIKSRCTDPEIIYELNELLNQPLKTAFSRIDQNHISRLGQNLNAAKNGLKRYEQLHYYDADAMKFVNSAFTSNNELRDELSRSEVDKIILEHAEVLRKIASPSTIPLIDGYTHPHDINQLIELAREHNYISETGLGRSFSSRIKTDNILEFDEEQEKSKNENRVRGIKKASAGIKIANGGLLVGANIAIGSLVGIVSALPTLGIGAVAASVGIATSIYTGLNTASEGLKYLATAIESK